MTYEVFRFDIYDKENHKQLESTRVSESFPSKKEMESWRRGKAQVYSQRYNTTIEILLSYKEHHGYGIQSDNQNR